MLFSIVLLLAADGSAPGFMSGRTLLALCDSDEVACARYIAGVSDALNAEQGSGMIPRYYCAPPHFTPGDAIDTVAKALRNDPATLDQGGAGLTITALRDAYPCKKE